MKVARLEVRGVVDRDAVVMDNTRTGASYVFTPEHAIALAGAMLAEASKCLEARRKATREGGTR